MNKCFDRSMEVQLPVLLGNYDRPMAYKPTNREDMKVPRDVTLPSSPQWNEKYPERSACERAKRSNGKSSFQLRKLRK